MVININTDRCLVNHNCGRCCAGLVVSIALELHGNLTRLRSRQTDYICHKLNGESIVPYAIDIYAVYKESKKLCLGVLAVNNGNTRVQLDFGFVSVIHKIDYIGVAFNKTVFISAVHNDLNHFLRHFAELMRGEVLIIKFQVLVCIQDCLELSHKRFNFYSTKG